MTRRLRVLLVEDNPRDAAIAEELLARSTAALFEVERAARLSEATARLAVAQPPIDAVLLDLSLPDSRPDDTFARLAAATTLPIVVLSGQGDEQLALAAVHGGAQDYLPKRGVTAGLLERALIYGCERAQARAALRVSEERYALAVAGANDGIWDWDCTTGKAYFSPRWAEILGEETFAGPIDAWFERVHGEDLPDLRRHLDLHLEGKSPHLEHEHRLRCRDGRYLWVLARGLAVRDGAGRALRMAGSLSDISSRKRSEQQLLHDAFHDTLTGLANRQLFRDRLSVELDQVRRRPGGHFAVLYFDLDRFKNINDSLGHAAGDELLRELAERLHSVLRPGDTIARLGGDEFAVLATGLASPLDATPIAERIQETLSGSVALGRQSVVTSASIGIACSHGGYESAEEMLRDADIAMYRAKAAGRSCYQVFDETMHKSAVALLRLENDLRRAVERQHFVMHYQPIVQLDSGRIAGFEALVRWNHPERGLVPPALFIGVAEETGLIVPLGWWVLREACRQASEWQARYPGDPPIYMSVNVSGKIVLQADMESQVLTILEEMKLKPESLRLEITESVIMEHEAEVLRKLQRLRELGVKFSIDDFGTGYSSLSYLQQFSYDTLKIDRSFIAGLGDREGGGAAIVQTIVALASMLRMNVVAEGVETPNQLERLRQLGCPHAQGYWFSRPVDRNDAEALLAAGAPPWESSVERPF